jgi:hypothetical protein
MSPIFDGLKPPLRKSGRVGYGEAAFEAAFVFIEAEKTRINGREQVSSDIAGGDPFA